MPPDALGVRLGARVPVYVDEKSHPLRGVLREGMAGLLESELRRSRPDERMRDRVAAALPMLPVLHAPETSTPSLFMLGGVAVKKSFVIVAIIVASLALGGVGGDSAPARSPQHWRKTSEDRRSRTQRVLLRRRRPALGAPRPRTSGIFGDEGTSWSSSPRCQ